MSSDPRSGRPHASSREVLAEAACELFLERGYESTSVADITGRAGVSRSSFFNYFSSKGDVLWAALDERIAALAAILETDESTDAAAAVRNAVSLIADDFAPDSLALAITHASTMGVTDELDRESAVRRARIAKPVAERLRRGGTTPLRSEVLAGAYGAAIVAAVQQWALHGPGGTRLSDTVTRALDDVAALPAAAGVRQLRLVVRADDFDAALAFYRDQLGLAERESFEGEGGARVTILAAGEATLELSNGAQVELIDRVETDGGTSDRMRVAFEVDDTATTVDRLTRAGARLEASARITPWRSLNARLRGPAGLQLTLFQELGTDGPAEPLA